MAGALIRTPRNAAGLREDPVILDCATNSTNALWSYNNSGIIAQGCTPTDSRFATTSSSNGSHCSLIVRGTSRSRLNGPYICADELEFAQAVVIVIGKSRIPLRYPGRRQVRGWSQICRRPASSCWLAASELDDRPNSSSLQVCDKPRTCLRPG